MTAWPHRIYDDRTLFHGPLFQVIEAVEGVSDVAMAARVTGLEAKKWSGVTMTGYRPMNVRYGGGRSLAALAWNDG